MSLNQKVTAEFSSSYIKCSSTRGLSIQTFRAWRISARRRLLVATGILYCVLMSCVAYGTS
jgi:hypothetical protein